MALNLDLWSDHEIIKDAIHIIERSASKDLVLPILRVLKKLRKETSSKEVFKMWVPKEDESYFVLDPLYPECQPENIRKNESWASFQPARLGLVFCDKDACCHTSRMLQILGKLANISDQQRQKWKLERWILVVKDGCLEIMESNVISMVGFSSRENALLAWDTLTEEEQAVFLQGF